MKTNNKIEVIVKDENDFMKLAQLSDYSSTITGVLAINKTRLSDIKKRFPKEYDKWLVEEVNKLEEERIENVKAEAYFDEKKGTIWLRNAPADILCYLEVWTEYKPLVKWSSIPQFFQLVNQGFIELDESLKNVLTKVDENTPIKEFLTAKMKTKKHMGTPNWNFNSLYGNDPISVLNLDELRIIKNPAMILPRLIVKSFDPDTKEATFFGIENGTKYTAKFYAVHPSLRRTLIEGREVSLMTSKVMGTEDRGYHMNQPIIVPLGFKLRYHSYIKPPRTFPTKNINALKAEYDFRSNLE